MIASSNAVTDPEECVRLGADAIAVAIGIFGPNEGRFIKMLMEQVTRAAKFDLPVIAHIYPRDFSGPVARNRFRSGRDHVGGARRD